MGRTIRTVEDVLQLLDTLFAPQADRWTADAGSWWDGFYADRGIRRTSHSRIHGVSGRAHKTAAEVRFVCGYAFSLSGTGLLGTYHLIYDSGCFHHLPPHRRIGYLALLEQHLAPGGRFGVACFAEGPWDPTCPMRTSTGRGGSRAVSPTRPSPCDRIFSDLTEIELRRMRAEPPESPCFGEPFLWTALFGRDG